MPRASRRDPSEHDGSEPDEAPAKKTQTARKAASAKAASTKAASAKKTAGAKKPTTAKKAAALAKVARAGAKKARLAAAVDRIDPETGLLDDSLITAPGEVMRVRRMHRRDINRIWDFLKRVFRDVNQKTVEYQRPRSKKRFEESYDAEAMEQLVFELGSEIVGYAECTFETTGSDNWINWRWFDNRDMRPLFVEELAVNPDYQGRGVGGFMLEQLRHIARLRGCTHLVLEVAENNKEALTFYRKRNFYKIDAAIFLAQKIEREAELLPPRPLRPPKN